MPFSFVTSGLARFEAVLRPFFLRLPPSVGVRLYSAGRRRFLATWARAAPRRRVEPPPDLSTTLWGLRFRSPILNAAGLFKNGEGYELCHRQGAGAWLAGTTTARPRRGNEKRGILQPFTPYPRSGAASNWLGLPNLGHEEVARRIAGLERYDGFPIGASVAAVKDDGASEEEVLAGWLEGLRLYERAGVDFLEINESCPNTGDEAAGSTAAEFAALRRRLTAIRDGFLERRSLPVIVKFSCDTELGQVEGLMKLLVELGFDGVNFGNTSVDYAETRSTIARSERRLYDHFTAIFGGGLSGRPLKERSLRLVEAAREALTGLRAGREFHVVRTGGVEWAADLRASEEAGVALNQWYTAYFEAFAQYGHGVYRELYGAIGKFGEPPPRPGREP